MPAKNDPSVFYVEASISPNGVEIGKVRMGVSTASVEADLRRTGQALCRPDCQR